jgi:hypothetical protein
MRIFSMLAVMFLGMSLLVGCSAKGDQKVSIYNPGHGLPPSSTASSRGVYELFASDTPNPLRKITLDRGAKFGFRDDYGVVIAFAQRLNKTGEKPVFEDVQFPLPGGDRVGYYWLRLGEKKK